MSYGPYKTPKVIGATIADTEQIVQGFKVNATGEVNNRNQPAAK